MSETKIRVKTSDGVEVEVDLEIAKQWAPIKNLYEGNSKRFLIDRISFLFYISSRHNRHNR